MQLQLSSSSNSKAKAKKGKGRAMRKGTISTKNGVDDEMETNCVYYIRFKEANLPLSRAPKQDKSELDPHQALEKVISTRINSFLEGYFLSPLGRDVARMWIRKATVDTTGKLERIKGWILEELKVSKRNRRAFSPWQQGCPELIPSLAARPVWQAAQLDFLQTLNEAYPAIKQELLSLKGKTGFQPYRAPSWASESKAKDGLGSISHDAGDWNVMYLLLHNMDFSCNQELCPLTTALVKELPNQYSHAFFSALAPGTHITKHHGPTNKKLRIHLPLIVPEVGSSLLRVGDEIISMEEGQAFVFDDSFEHEAWNNHPSQSRICLIIDIWHPELTYGEIKFLKFLQDALLKAQKKVCSRKSGAVLQKPIARTTERNYIGVSDDITHDDNFFSIIEQAKTIPANPTSVWS